MNINFRNRKSLLSIGLGVVISVGAVFSLTACTGDQGNDSQQRNQKVTEQYSKQLADAEPYPLAAMKDSSERANLIERLLRMNNPNKIGYVYEITQNGQILAEYTIKGKVSSTDSQLTNSDNITTQSDLNSSGGNVVTRSMGDDGSYGSEEGGTNGIFFFTTSGVLVEWNGLWQYSDAPLDLTSKPLITINENAVPSSTAGKLK